MVTVERRCIECNHIRKMEHNGLRCYDCAMKRRTDMDSFLGIGGMVC